MAKKTFTAMLVEETAPKQFTRRLVSRSVDELPAGELLVKVHYSSLNYKDALSATGRPGVTKKYPHTPGIDAAGVVEVSETDQVQPGDAVIVTSYDLGMNTAGGFGGYIRVPGAWVVPLPASLSLRESMIYGTAGFTAGLSLLRLEEHGLSPDKGAILVTGATGGLGSLAVAILAKAGYSVVAATGKPQAEDFLKSLGATEVISREDATDTSNRPMLKSRWAGVIDTAGGQMLATAIKSTRYGGSVACCGLVASPDLSTTVYPFILRGVNLLGIDSGYCEMSIRRKIWGNLASPWKPDRLEQIATERTLDQLSPEIDRILQGQQTGRILITHRPTGNSQ